MPKRDPEKTARNKVIKRLSDELKALLPQVLSQTGLQSELSVNAVYGSKFANYIDIKNEVINSPDHFISLYLDGFERAAKARPRAADGRNFALLQSTPVLQEYLSIFLERVYLRHIDSLSKKRPTDEEAAIWIGQNHANYGLFVTPRFNIRTNEWENDRSEIRHFSPAYWTIGHVLETGLVIPGKNQKIQFQDIADYLNFFLNVLVRNSGSQHEYKLAEMYRDFVNSAQEPTRVPLLIPEFRYEGIVAQHRYRLDFTIIHPFELTKVGFELSPWSTHGYLRKTKSLNQTQINEIAKGNFEREMKKHKEFFRKHGIYALIYTDTDLRDLDAVFQDMTVHLQPTPASRQLRFRLMRDILGRN